MRTLRLLPLLLPFLCTPALAQYQDPFEFHSALPTDCDEVRGIKDIKTGKMDYLFILTCNRAHYWYYSKLQGVKQVKKNVIYIPKQKLGNTGNFKGSTIEGYFCSTYPPNIKAGRAFSCTASGWVAR